jgi:alanine racemase
MESILRDTIVEVNLDNIIFNIRSIRDMVGEDVAIAAVVKANGYGHGAVGISKVLMENGADCLAVATLSEAMDLRNHFKDYKIFIMGFTPDEYLNYVVENNIIQTIFSYKQAEILNELGVKNNIKPVVHIKYDTGFNRLGFKDCEESLDEIEKICNLKNIEVEGIFSHLALAGKEENQIQYTRFTNAIENLENRKINFKYKHIEDSISAVDHPEYRMNMIRPGAIIYGIKGFHYGSLDLKQALKFKSKIYHIKKISKGEGVSYDYMWQAQEDSIIGTIPFGYADGYPRNLRDKGFVTIHGKKAPILGVICMDQCMVDLTHIPEAKVGDEVIIYGDGANNTLDLDTASKLAGTNKNEIIARISMRPPRVYIKNGNIVNVVNYI